MEAIKQELNIEGLMELDRELQVKKGNEFGYAGIWLFTGAQGSGKTLLLIKRTPSETFKTQCNMVERTGERDTPGKFFFTVPSLEYFIAITGINIHGSRILKVREKETNGIKYFEIYMVLYLIV